MKKVTHWITLLGIVVCMVLGFQSLQVPLTGLVYGLFLATPLFVTLVMSNLLVGTATQTILLGSSVGYLANLMHRVYFISSEGAPSSPFYSILVMIALWLVAGFRSHTRDEIERRHDRNRPELRP